MDASTQERRRKAVLPVNSPAATLPRMAATARALSAPPYQTASSPSTVRTR